jgi:cytochrome P450
MANVTNDIVSHTLFGSSYEQGKKVLDGIASLMLNRSKQPFVTVPGHRLLPLPINIKNFMTQNAISRSISEIIQLRKDMVKVTNNTSYGNDLLGIMLTATSKKTTTKGEKVHFGMQQVIDNCKTFFLIGNDSTRTLLTWTMMLLASHTTWQERAREEVIEVCGHGDYPLNFEMFSNLKTLTMILYETLRLFPPFTTQIRQATMDIMIGDLHIPKGACTFFPRLAIHHDPELWGIDVHEFKPERFVDGIAKASKHESAFQPFSFGKKSCLGQGFSLQQAKVVLVTMLRRFRFHLSPNYRHAPHIKLTLTPKYGVPLILECLD